HHAALTAAPQGPDARRAVRRGIAPLDGLQGRNVLVRVADRGHWLFQQSEIAAYGADARGLAPSLLHDHGVGRTLDRPEPRAAGAREQRRELGRRETGGRHVPVTVGADRVPVARIAADVRARPDGFAAPRQLSASLGIDQGEVTPGHGVDEHAAELAEAA